MERFVVERGKGMVRVRIYRRLSEEIVKKRGKGENAAWLAQAGRRRRRRVGGVGGREGRERKMRKRTSVSVSLLLAAVFILGDSPIQ